MIEQFFEFAGPLAFLLMIVLIIASLPRRSSERWTKPTARKLGDNYIEVSGNTEEISRMGVPATGTWTHTGHKTWKVETTDPDNAVKTINDWDGRLQ
jgi:hypothetical protein